MRREQHHPSPFPCLLQPSSKRCQGQESKWSDYPGLFALPSPACILPVTSPSPLSPWLHPSHHLGWSFPNYSLPLYPAPCFLALLFNSCHWHPLVFLGPSLFLAACTPLLKAAQQESCLSQAMSPQCWQELPAIFKGRRWKLLLQGMQDRWLQVQQALTWWREIKPVPIAFWQIGFKGFHAVYYLQPGEKKLI